MWPIQHYLPHDLRDLPVQKPQEDRVTTEVPEKLWTLHYLLESLGLVILNSLGIYQVARVTREENVNTPANSRWNTPTVLLLFHFAHAHCICFYKKNCCNFKKTSWPTTQTWVICAVHNIFSILYLYFGKIIQMFNKKRNISIERIKKEYPLHFCVWFNDFNELEKLLQTSEVF